MPEASSERLGADVDTRLYRSQIDFLCAPLPPPFQPHSATPCEPVRCPTSAEPYSMHTGFNPSKSGYIQQVHVADYQSSHIRSDSCAQSCVHMGCSATFYASRCKHGTLCLEGVWPIMFVLLTLAHALVPRFPSTTKTAALCTTTVTVAPTWMKTTTCRGGINERTLPSQTPPHVGFTPYVSAELLKLESFGGWRSRVKEAAGWQVLQV